MVPPFYLLIDVKTAATPTYKRLHEVLARYADMFDDGSKMGKVEPRAITQLWSAAIATKRQCLHRSCGTPAWTAGLRDDLDGKDLADLMPWISERWGALFTWNGVGEMPAAWPALRPARNGACAVPMPKRKLLRLWATPEKQDSLGRALFGRRSRPLHQRLTGSPSFATFLREKEKSK